MSKRNRRQLISRELDELTLAAEKNYLLQRLLNTGILLLAAAAGSGKTTGLPIWSYLLGRLRGRIVVVVPRRILAIRAAQRMAKLLNSPVGELVGYHIQGERCFSRGTRILVVTEARFFRMVLHDPQLRRVALVMLDEVHLRTVVGDFCAERLRKARQLRPDLKVIVASATISPELQLKLEDYWQSRLVDCDVAGAEVDIRYVGGETRVSTQVAHIIRSREFAPCTILCFLPGLAEIRQEQSELRQLIPAHVEILCFYGSQDRTEQMRVFEPTRGWRVILATNLAQMGHTFPADIVVDSGYVKLPSYDRHTGAPSLHVVPCSKIAADQRAWRIGRLGIRGVCFRLWSEQEHDSRPSEQIPEINRLPLEGVLLRLYARGLTDIAALKLLDQPVDEQIATANRLLYRLGAINKEDRSLTALGKEMEPMDLQPRLARILLAARRLNCVKPVLVLVAFQSVGHQFLLRIIGKQELADVAQAEFFKEGDLSDLLPVLRAFIAVRRYEKEVRQKLRKERLSERRIDSIMYSKVRAFCEMRWLHANTYFQALRIMENLMPIVRRHRVPSGRHSTLPMVAEAYAAGFPECILIHDREGDWSHTLYNQNVLLSSDSVARKLLQNGVPVRWMLASELKEKMSRKSGPFLVATEVTVLQENSLRNILGDLMFIQRSGHRWSAERDCVICDEEWLVEGGTVVNKVADVVAPRGDIQTRRAIAAAVASGEIPVPGFRDNLVLLGEAWRRSAGVIRKPVQDALEQHVFDIIGDAATAEEISALSDRLNLSWEQLSQLTETPNLQSIVEQAKLDYPDQLLVHGVLVPVSYRRRLRRIVVSLDQQTIGVLAYLTIADRPAAWAENRVFQITVQWSDSVILEGFWTAEGLDELRRLVTAHACRWSLPETITVEEDILRAVKVIHPDRQELFWMVANRPILYADRQKAVVVAEAFFREQLWRRFNQDTPTDLTVPESSPSGGLLPAVKPLAIGTSPISGETVNVYAAPGLIQDGGRKTIRARWWQTEQGAHSALAEAQSYFDNLCLNLQSMPAVQDTASEVAELQAKLIALYERYAAALASESLNDEALRERFYEIRWQDLPWRRDLLKSWQEQVEALIAEIGAATGSV